MYDLKMEEHYFHCNEGSSDKIYGIFWFPSLKLQVNAWCARTAQRAQTKTIESNEYQIAIDIEKRLNRNYKTTQYGYDWKKLKIAALKIAEPINEKIKSIAKPQESKVCKSVEKIEPNKLFTGVCVNNIGFENNFERNIEYVLQRIKQGNDEMFEVEDMFGKKITVVPSRFKKIKEFME